MVKIIKVLNPEILKNKYHRIWDYVDLEVEYKNGVRNHRKRIQQRQQICS